MPLASDNTVSVLTPPGVGAIACVAIRGPAAWDAARRHFRPVGQPLPERPAPGRFWFGTLGTGDAPGDEVILSAKAEDSFEIHCHGGRRIARWVVELFLAEGFTETPPTLAGESTAWDALTHATTERTAAILLDQCHGAFRRAVEAILADLDGSRKALARLAALAPIGRHLVEPWRVVIAGPPNVGKSSLLNALAGYARSIVAPVAGTTRDVVTARLAFDGWPFEVSDTAGLHDTPGEIESAGIARAADELARADLVLWVKDASADRAEEPPATLDPSRLLTVWNKADLHAAGGPGIAVSARTGAGVSDLITAIVARLVPAVPEPREAVPYSAPFADAVVEAWLALQSGNPDAARTILATCLAASS